LSAAGRSGKGMLGPVLKTLAAALVTGLAVAAAGYGAGPTDPVRSRILNESRADGTIAARVETWVGGAANGSGPYRVTGSLPDNLTMTVTVVPPLVISGVTPPGFGTARLASGRKWVWSAARLPRNRPVQAALRLLATGPGTKGCSAVLVTAPRLVAPLKVRHCVTIRRPAPAT
jgi:hypothetical protein